MNKLVQDNTLKAFLASSEDVVFVCLAEVYVTRKQQSIKQQKLAEMQNVILKDKETVQSWYCSNALNTYQLLILHLSLELNSQLKK